MPSTCTLEITQVGQANIEVSLVAPGPPGPNAIGGFAIALGATPKEDSLLQLKGGVWVDTPQENIVDGGNF